MSSVASVKFVRFDRSSDGNITGLAYKTYTKPEDTQPAMKAVTMEKIGLNLHVTVKNYLLEPVLLTGNLRADPIRVPSLRRENLRPDDSVNNCVVITILSQENTSDLDQKHKLAGARRTEIRVPGKILNSGSLFIDELGYYLTTDSQIDATRSQMSKDLFGPVNEVVTVPAESIKNNPVVMYSKYKDLVQDCLVRQDRIRVRTGIDLQHDVIPPILKSLRISILDSYFIPFTSYNLEYDPFLSRDTLMIDNLYPTSSPSFKTTLGELSSAGVIYLDHNQQKCLFGRFYDMALFADADKYANYVYECKAFKKLDDDLLYVAERSGDPRLREEVQTQKLELTRLREEDADKTQRLTHQGEVIKRLRLDLKERDERIRDVLEHRDAETSKEVVLRRMDIEDKRLDLDEDKLSHDQQELVHKSKAAILVHKATTLKSVADILKSGWGIATACFAGVLSVFALCKKYDIKLTMGQA